MALTACIECDKQISDTAPACPHCGYKALTIAAVTVAPTQDSGMGFGTLMMLVLGFFIVLIVVMAGLGSAGNNSSGPPGVSNTNVGSYGKESQPYEAVREEQARQAELCKNGYASACETEKLISDLQSSAGTPPL